MACGLVDTLVSSHDLDSLAVDGGDHDTESFLDYASAAGTHNGPRIALLVAEGEIIDGRSRDGAFGGRSVGDETLIEALRDIADDDDVRALVLRIDSPGGSGDASEAVWHEIRRVRREKPVVVSLGDVAASGGYYLASAGDSVLASPATITGSIGVFGGKLNMLGLYQKLGLNVETVSRGRHAEMFSPWRDFTDEERERFQRQLEQFYTTFLERVAEGRGLEVAAVDSVGQGRVWSGRAARERGLVDDFGGLHEAIGAARTLAGIEDGPVAIEEYPRPRQSLAQRWITDLLREEDASERLGLPGLDMLGQWVRLSGTRAGQVMAMLPYAIRID
jgi:protease-4